MSIALHNTIIYSGSFGKSKSRFTILYVISQEIYAIGVSSFSKYALAI